MEGRQILYATLIANEVVDALLMRKERGFYANLISGRRMITLIGIFVERII